MEQFLFRPESPDRRYCGRGGPARVLFCRAGDAERQNHLLKSSCQISGCEHLRRALAVAAARLADVGP